MGDSNVYNKNIDTGDLLLIYFDEGFINKNQLLEISNNIFSVNPI